jgi:hypothetical protein
MDGGSAESVDLLNLGMLSVSGKHGIFVEGVCRGVCPPFSTSREVIHGMNCRTGGSRLCGIRIRTSIQKL